MKYRAIVADPPWHYDWQGAPESAKTRKAAVRLGLVDYDRSRARKGLPYKSLSLDAIRALPVGDFAERDAHLYLWTTNHWLPQAFSVLEAWGFRYSTTLIWCKTPMGAGLGGAFQPSAEFVLFARRGRLKHLRRQDSTWFHWPRTGVHSKKPEAFLDLVEQVSPGPYLEMFARRNRLGWDTWGNEALTHVEIAS